MYLTDKRSLDCAKSSFELAKDLKDKLPSEALASRYSLLGKALIHHRRFFQDGLFLLDEAREIKEIFEDALSIWESCNINHPKISTGLLNIGMAYTYLRDNQTAIEYFEKGKDAAERINGPESYQVAIAVLNSAGSKHRQGKIDEAISGYLKATEIQEKFLGSQHPQLLQSLLPIASYHVTKNQYKEAWDLLQKAQKIAENAFGPTHLDTAHVYAGFAYYFRSQKKYEEAIAYRKKALDICVELLPENHKFIVEVLLETAKNYTELKKISEAEECLEKAKAIDKKIFERHGFSLFQSSKEEESTTDTSSSTSSLEKKEESECIIV